MNISSSPQSVRPSSAVMTRPAIGAHARSLLFLIATLAVAVSLALGFVLHLTVSEYQLPGLPIQLLFQPGIHRQLLRTLWVRSGPPLELSGWFFVLRGVFALFPTYAVAREAIWEERHRLAFGDRCLGAVGPVAPAGPGHSNRAASLHRRSVARRSDSRRRSPLAVVAQEWQPGDERYRSCVAGCDPRRSLRRWPVLER